MQSKLVDLHRHHQNPREQIKKLAILRTAHRFSYLQDVSYYTNAPGIKKKKKRGVREGGEKWRKRTKNVSLEHINNHNIYFK